MRQRVVECIVRISRYGRPILFLWLCGLLAVGCKSAEELDAWSRVCQYKQLHIGVILNPIEYYVSQGKTSGFSYEVGQLLADSMGLEAVFHIYYTYEDAYLGLLDGTIELLAAADNPQPEWEGLFSFTTPLCYSDLVMVSRKADKRRKKAENDSEDTLNAPSLVVSLPAVFMDEAAMYLWRNSSGGQVTVKYVTAASDQLLQTVEDGRYRMTITYGRYWRACAYLFPHLEQSETLQDNIPLCWVLKRGCDSLLLHCNATLEKLKAQPLLGQLLKKYTHPASAERVRLAGLQSVSPYGAISKYDGHLQAYASKYQIDWFLLAALIYQESRFKMDVVGKGNTYGLMQFTPGTASKYGVYASASPAQQIEAGCRYLHALKKILEKEGVTDSAEQVPMMVAAYNAGSGHLTDAIAVARAEGWDASVWKDNVEQALLCLDKHAYYHKNYVKNGRDRAGRRTAHYVQSVLLRRERYRALSERDSLNEVK